MRKRRRRARRNPEDHSVKQIAWTVGITALTAATTAFVVWYVNKKLTAGELPAATQPTNAYNGAKTAPASSPNPVSTPAPNPPTPPPQTPTMMPTPHDQQIQQKQAQAMQSDRGAWNLNTSLQFG